MEKDFHEEMLVMEKKGFRKAVTAKIICIGDCSVGKTSIICRFIQGRFKTNNQTTLGVEYFKKTMRIENDDILLEIWDTAGQERYRSLVKFFYKNAKGAILVFDLGDKGSFSNLDFWLKSIKNNSDREMVIFVVGNKCDKENLQVNEEEIKAFCENNELMYFQTSAKEDIKIREVFYELGKKIKENYDKNKSLMENSVSSEFSEVRNEKGCTVCEC